jgi:hypothetical protein
MDSRLAAKEAEKSAKKRKKPVAGEASPVKSKRKS